MHPPALCGPSRSVFGGCANGSAARGPFGGGRTGFWGGKTHRRGGFSSPQNECASGLRIPKNSKKITKKVFGVADTTCRSGILGCFERWVCLSFCISLSPPLPLSLFFLSSLFFHSHSFLFPPHSLLFPNQQKKTYTKQETMVKKKPTLNAKIIIVGTGGVGKSVCSKKKPSRKLGKTKTKKMLLHLFSLSLFFFLFSFFFL